jgi:hypothetical protein
MNTAFVIYREEGAYWNYSKHNLLVVQTKERAEEKVTELMDKQRRLERDGNMLRDRLNNFEVEWDEYLRLCEELEREADCKLSSSFYDVSYDYEEVASE